MAQEKKDFDKGWVLDFKLIRWTHVKRVKSSIMVRKQRALEYVWVLYGPQMSQWIKSNNATDFIELELKDKRVCFAKGQMLQTCLGLNLISGIVWDKV